MPMQATVAMNRVITLPYVLGYPIHQFTKLSEERTHTNHTNN